MLLHRRKDLAPKQTIFQKSACQHRFFSLKRCFIGVMLFITDVGKIWMPRHASIFDMVSRERFSCLLRTVETYCWLQPISSISTWTPPPVRTPEKCWPGVEPRCLRKRMPWRPSRLYKRKQTTLTLCWMKTELKIDSIRHITCKLQYNVLYLSIQIKIFNYGTVNIINESRWNSQEKFW